LNFVTIPSGVLLLGLCQKDDTWKPSVGHRVFPSPEGLMSYSVH